MHTGHIYRKTYGLFLSNGILYNHESPRRGENFVTQKIVHGAASVAQGKLDHLELGNLDIERDWGYAPLCAWNVDDVTAEKSHPIMCWQLARPINYPHFLEIAFKYFDLDYQEYVCVNEKFIRPSEPQKLCGDSTKAQKILGWKPSLSFAELIFKMCKAASNKQY